MQLVLQYTCFVGITGCGIFFTSDQAKAPVIIEQVCQRVLPANLEVCYT